MKKFPILKASCSKTSICLLFASCLALSANSQTQKVSHEEIWNKISIHFNPPAQYANDFGSYRSPLKFYNGDTLITRREWSRRRQEIFDKWNEMMGKWPPFITGQKIEILETSHRDNFTQYTISFEWLPGQKTKGYLLVPDIKGKKPAVVTVYYEPETAIGKGGPFRDFAYQLAKRGFVTLSIGTTETTNAKTYSLYYPSVQNSDIQPLSVLAYAASNAWHLLAEHAEVDAKRIGIMGHSYGGKWAMFASCLFDKFACSVWSDPGIVFDDERPNVNYWEPWYLGYYPPPWDKTWRKSGDVAGAKGLYPKLRSDGYDLHELHALMAPRPFLVSGGSEDSQERWVPLNHSIAVNELLGYKNRVAMTNRPEHTPDEDSNEQAYLFLEYFLKKTE